MRARMGDGRRRVRVHVLSEDLAQHEAGDGKKTKCGKVGKDLGVLLSRKGNDPNSTAWPPGVSG